MTMTDHAQKDAATDIDQAGGDTGTERCFSADYAGYRDHQDERQQSPYVIDGNDRQQGVHEFPPVIAFVHKVIGCGRIRRRSNSRKQQRNDRVEAHEDKRRCNDQRRAQDLAERNSYDERAALPECRNGELVPEQKTDERQCDRCEVGKPLVHETLGHDRKTGGTDRKTTQHQQGHARQERRPPHDVGDEANQEKQAKRS